MAVGPDPLFKDLGEKNFELRTVHATKWGLFREGFRPGMPPLSSATTPAAPASHGAPSSASHGRTKRSTDGGESRSKSPRGASSTSPRQRADLYEALTRATVDSPGLRGLLIFEPCDANGVAPGSMTMTSSTWSLVSDGTGGQENTLRRITVQHVVDARGDIGDDGAVGGAGRSCGTCGRKPADHDLPVVCIDMRESQPIPVLVLDHCDYCAAYLFGKLLASQKAPDAQDELVLSVDIASEVQVFVAHMPNDYLEQQDAYFAPFRSLVADCGAVLSVEI